MDELLEMADLRDRRKELTKICLVPGVSVSLLSAPSFTARKCFFLDEATAGVDPLARRSFWDLIYRLAGQGISVLATTHYMDEADYCNIIAMMYQGGEIVALAGPDEIKDQLPGVLVQIDVDQPVEAQEFLSKGNNILHSSLQGVQLHVTVPDENEIPALQSRLDQAGFSVHSLEIIQPSLEDAFTAMVNEERKERL